GTLTYPPLIQFSITPLASVTRNAMVNGTFTTYGYPTNTSSGKIPYTTNLTGQAALVAGHCDPAVVPYSCHVTINGLGAISRPYMIHFLDLYDASQVDITGQTATGAAIFSGGQAEVDVTGKAQNVLKRLQVRVPLSAAANFANYAIQAQNICKLMESG